MAAFTKQELINGARKAYAQGDLVRAKRIVQMIDELPPESPALGDPNTTMGKVTRTVGDIENVAADAITRGMASKFAGEQAQADTRASRERLPDYAELPVDIAGAVVGSPYRVGSMLVGGVAGGLEGAATAYGHQENWVPDWQGVKDIGWEAGKGAVLGSGAAKIGQKIGDWWGGKAAKAAQKYPTDEALEAATTKLLYRNPASKKALAQADRIERVKAARVAQGEGTREAFAKLRAAGPKEKAAQAAITKEPGVFSKMVQGVGKAAAPIGNKAGLAAMIETGAHGSPGVLTAATTGAKTLSEIGKRTGQLSPRQMEEYVALVRDPKGKGIAADPATVDAWRTLLAQMAVGAGRSPITPDPQNFRPFGGPR